MLEGQNSKRLERLGITSKTQKEEKRRETWSFWLTIRLIC